MAASGGALPLLTNRTPILGLKLYILILIFVAIVVAVVLLVSLCIRRSRSSEKRKMRVKHSSGTIPLVSKEIVEVLKIEHVNDDDDDPKQKQKKQVELEIEESVSAAESPSPNIGWGRWYSLKELEIATNGFVEGNVIGEGGYGIVYKGVLQDGSVVAVKNLLNNKYVTQSHCPISFLSAFHFSVFLTLLDNFTLLLSMLICSCGITHLFTSKIREKMSYEKVFLSLGSHILKLQ